jgi:hypothetical protein
VAACFSSLPSSSAGSGGGLLPLLIREAVIVVNVGVRYNNKKIIFYATPNFPKIYLLVML